MTWHKSKFQGIRYREHKTRKHGVTPDRYYTIFYKLDGKMVQEALGWASEGWEEADKDGTKKKANWTEKRASTVLAELKKNQSTGNGPRTLKEKRAIQRQESELQKAEGITAEEFWNQDYETHLKSRIKEGSWRKEISLFKKWIAPFIGNKALKSITPQDVERIVENMRAKGSSPRTQQYAIGTVFRIWKHAAKRKLVKIGDNPASGIKLEQVNNSRTRVLTPQELRDILDVLEISDPFGYPLVVFCAYTGCRFSEAAKLTWEHFSESQKTALFTDTKNKELREIHLDDSIVNLLVKEGVGKTGQYVFNKKDGTPFIKPPNSFVTAVNNLGLNTDREPRDRVSLHTLRHTAATLAARYGTPVKDMQLIFGWKTPSMVFRYVKGDKETQKSVMKGLAQALSGEDSKIVPIAQSCA
jgi:integrase